MHCKYTDIHGVEVVKNCIGKNMSSRIATSDVQLGKCWLRKEILQNDAILQDLHDSGETLAYK